MKTIQEADFLIYNGAGMEHWVKDVLDGVVYSAPRVNGEISGGQSSNLRTTMLIKIVFSICNNVTLQVSVGVVVFLEIIDIQHQNPDIQLFGGRAFKELHDPMFKIPSIAS